jgi:hypothetical protein
MLPDPLKFERFHFCGKSQNYHYHFPEDHEIWDGSIFTRVYGEKERERRENQGRFQLVRFAPLTSSPLCWRNLLFGLTVKPIYVWCCLDVNRTYC